MEKYVMCIDNCGYKHELTIEEIYEVLPGCVVDCGFVYRIVNDRGFAAEYNVKRFVEVKMVSE